MATNWDNLPLSGVRVLEFTTGVAGPIVGHILGDMGAEVIKVEAPWSRGRRPPPNMQPLAPGAPDRPYNRSTLFNELNRSKLSAVLDVAKPAGRELFLRLVGLSDIVVENFAPRVIENLRLTYEDLRRARPDLILISMPAFGRSGPLRDWASYGPGIDAMSGLAHLTGYGDGRPLKPGNFFCNQNAGLLAAFAALAALHRRRGSGRGMYIECAMLEGELQLAAEAIMDCAANGCLQQPIGNRHPSMAPHGVYPCRGENRWIAVAVASDDEWSRLCQAMGRPELAREVRFADVVSRHRHQDELDSIITSWTSELDHYEAMKRLQAAGVAAGAALDVAELFDDPHVSHRQYFQFVEQAESGPAPYPRVAFQLSRTSAPLRRPAPAFGEHNDYVYRRLLGLSALEVEDLYAQGVISREPSGAEG